MATIKFAEPPLFLSKGRNGYLQTHGVDITDWSVDPGATNRTVVLHPIGIKDQTSTGCRICLNKAELPAIIAALQAIDQS